MIRFVIGIAYGVTLCLLVGEAVLSRCPVSGHGGDPAESVIGVLRVPCGILHGYPLSQSIVGIGNPFCTLLPGAVAVAFFYQIIQLVIIIADPVSSVGGIGCDPSCDIVGTYFLSSCGIGHAGQISFAVVSKFRSSSQIISHARHAVHHIVGIICHTSHRFLIS